MEADEDTPGRDAVPPRRELKTLLLKRFQSQTHIADARKTLNEMSFDTRGKEDIEAFATIMDAQLNIVGILYDEDNQVTNGSRAEHLLKALPPWLEQKIREQRRPYRCEHEQGYLGRGVDNARLIVSAQVARPREDYNGKQR